MSVTIWDLMYALGVAPWDTGITPPELIRVVEDGTLIPPARALDVGCGTGTNVVFLAQQGFEAVGVDISRWAIRRARARIAQNGVAARARCYVYNVTRLHLAGSPVQGPFHFVLDIGCFHGLNESGRGAYARMLATLLEPGGHYLLYAHLTGSDEPPVLQEPPPPTDWRRRVIRLLRGTVAPPRVPREVVEDTFRPLCDLVWFEKGRGGGGVSGWFLWRRRKRG